MKVYSQFEAILISAKESEYKAQNGGTGKTYSLAIAQEDEAGNLPCEKSIYDAVKGGAFPKYARCLVTGVYDSNYKSMRIVDLRGFEKAK